MTLFGLALGALGWMSAALAAAGIAYTIMAGLFVRRFFSVRPDGGGPHPEPPDITVLKPLHGAERRLDRNLRSLLDQDYAGRVQIVFGMANRDDPALTVAQALIPTRANVKISVCVDPRTHGRNAKVSNLINMMAFAKNSVVVLSDSDIGVTPDYLDRVQRTLEAPGVGVVTCPYYGEGAAGFWSNVAAMGISHHFLPNVITGVSLSMAHPCMGSTVALRRETLDRIGGFEAFRDVLADDYAIGAAVRDFGLASVLAPVLVSHDCTEQTLGEVFAHELRWAKTVKGVDFAGHAGSLVTHPFALALGAALLLGLSVASLALLAVAFIARVWLMRTVDGVIGRRSGSWWLLPPRDMLSFVVFVGSFFVRSVEWRGARFQVSKDGDLKPV